MKIVRIFGGLGNQMFQYALAVALREIHPDEQMWIDASCMKGYPLHNGYELQRIFGTSIAQAPQAQVARVAWPLPHYRLWQLGRRVLPRRRSMVVEGRDMAFMPDLTGRSDDLLLEGYWQTERYFRTAAGAVRRAFRFPDFEPGSRNVVGCAAGWLYIALGACAAWRLLENRQYVRHMHYGLLQAGDGCHACTRAAGAGSGLLRRCSVVPREFRRAVGWSAGRVRGLERRK